MPDHLSLISVTRRVQGENRLPKRTPVACYGPATPINKCEGVFVKDNNHGHQLGGSEDSWEQGDIDQAVAASFYLPCKLVLLCAAPLLFLAPKLLSSLTPPLSPAVHFNKESGNLAPTFFSVKKGQASGVNTGGWGEKLVSISSLPPA